MFVVRYPSFACSGADPLLQYQEYWPKEQVATLERSLPPLDFTAVTKKHKEVDFDDELSATLYDLRKQLSASQTDKDRKEKPSTLHVARRLVSGKSMSMFIHAVNSYLISCLISLLPTFSSRMLCCSRFAYLRAA